MDKGYRGHDYQGPAKVLLAKPRRKQDPKLRRWYNKRNGIEAMISHMKNDGWLGRNYLKGTLGSRINALLAACGQNLRKLLAWLATHARLFFVSCSACWGGPSYPWIALAGPGNGAPFTRSHTAHPKAPPRFAPAGLQGFPCSRSLWLTAFFRANGIVHITDWFTTLLTNDGRLPVPAGRVL